MRRPDIKINPKVIKVCGLVLAGIVFFVLALLSCSVLWMYSVWGKNLSINDFLFQVQMLEGTGNEMVIKYLLGALLPAVIITTVPVAIFIYFTKKEIEYIPALIKWSFISVITATWGVFLFGVKWLKVDEYFGFAGFRASTAEAYVPPVIETIIPETVVISSGAEAEDNEWSDFQMTLAREETPWTKGDSRDFIESYYVDPATVDLVFPEKKRNLIFIYLESMEMTFANREVGGAFDENVIKNLTLLSQENENFSGSYGEGSMLDGGYAYSGGTWTIGAIFSSTSGIPLQTSGLADHNDMNTQDAFYPTITTLGDILHDAGYRQIFMIGSSAIFGGRQLYLTNHGEFEFRDLNWAKRTGHLPAGYYVWWGYEDQKLFSYAKETLEELGSGDEPFNFTMLTVDTHMTGGYTCELCGDEFENRYSNVYACSDRQVSEFIEWIKQQDFYENTTIILMGDHPTMDATYCRNIDNDYVRRVYTCVLNAPVSPVRTAYRSYSTLDMFPTTLSTLGVEIPGGRLGLGTSLYTNQRTLTEELGYTAVSSSLSRFSSFLDELGDIIPTDASGNQIIYNDDGSVTIRGEDGSLVTMYPDGSQLVVTPDGIQTIISVDGTQTVLPDLYIFPEETISPN